MKAASVLAVWALFGAFQMQAAALAPSVHNMSVDLEPLLRDGSNRVGYICETQPREYVDTRGRIHVVIDHYVQLDECPAVPIK